VRNGEYILVVAPDDYPGKKYRGRYCYEHILVFWQHYHVLPGPDEIIHHIDGNKHNNNIENLQLKTREKHTSEHKKQQGKNMLRLICPGCGNEFTVEKRQSYMSKPYSCTCCSRKCIGFFTALTTEEKQRRIQNMFVSQYKQYA